MSRSAEPRDAAPDVRGRRVVWTAGVWSPGSSVLGGAGRTPYPVWRRLGLVLTAVAAVVTLAYAVQAWVVLAPPPAGASVPLWLPDQLPVDEAAGTDDPTPTARPAATRTADDHVRRAATVPTARPRPAAPAGGKPTASARARASGHGPSRRPGQDKGSSGSPSSSASGGHDDSGGSHGSSGGGSSHDSSSGSGTKGGGSGHGGSDDHGSRGGNSKGGSGHGGSDDKGSNDHGGGSKGKDGGSDS